MKNRIELVHGDITKMACDVIVNAANKYLVPGGGVDGAIHSAGGAAILTGCRNYISRFGELETGQAMITEAGRLSAQAVIHTVGPKIISDLTKEDELLLRASYRNVLELVVEKGYRTVAFPNISTGIYGFPKGQASQYAFSEVVDFLTYNKTIECVYFVCHDKINYELYKALLEGYFERT